MMARRTFGVVVLGVAAALLSGCDWITAPARPHVVRYRLVATVDTPVGERSGHSVIEVAMSRTSGTFDVRGEAVAVDLPNNQTLFVLLRSANDADWAAWALNVIPNPEKDMPAKDAQARIDQVARWIDMLKADLGVHPVWTPEAPHTRPGSTVSVPYFVKFGDISDPASVAEVDPNNLAKSFGEGYRLRALTIQVADAPVTKGINKRLVWLSSHTGMLDNSGDHNRLHDDPIKNLTKRNFVQGDMK
jgi:hypothetical protein